MVESFLRNPLRPRTGKGCKKEGSFFLDVRIPQHPRKCHDYMRTAEYDRHTYLANVKFLAIRKSSKQRGSMPSQDRIKS